MSFHLHKIIISAELQDLQGQSSVNLYKQVAIDQSNIHVSIPNGARRAFFRPPPTDGTQFSKSLNSN